MPGQGQVSWVCQDCSRAPWTCSLTQHCMVETTAIPTWATVSTKFCSFGQRSLRMSKVPVVMVFAPQQSSYMWRENRVSSLHFQVTGTSLARMESSKPPNSSSDFYVVQWLDRIILRDVYSWPLEIPEDLARARGNVGQINWS